MGGRQVPEREVVAFEAEIEARKAETPNQRQLRVAAELDANTRFGTTLPRCEATFMSWPNGRVRCRLFAGHSGSHR